MAQPREDKLKLVESIKFPISYRKLHSDNPSLKAICDSFIRNVDQVRHLAGVPIKFVALSVLRTNIEFVARTNLNIPYTENPPELEVEGQRLMREFHANPNYSDLLSEMGIKNSEILMLSTPDLDQGVSVILEGMIVNGWTAFECMASDLWELALNIGPKDWVNSFVACGKGAKDQEKSVTISQLNLYEFDLRESMGTVLKKKGGFQSWKDISAAYSSAFGQEMTDILSDVRYQELDAMESIRHVISHRAGVVDQQFLLKVQRFPQWSTLPPAKSIPLDGHAVARLMNCAVSCGVSMIEWFKPKLG